MIKCVIDVEAIEFSNAADIYREGLKEIEKKTDLVMDVTNVNNVDISGIAVLFSWWQDAIRMHVNCHFELSSSVIEVLHAHDLELP